MPFCRLDRLCDMASSQRDKTDVDFKGQTFRHDPTTLLYEHLFGYQQLGFRYIYERLQDGKGTLLGDYMGLGKTMQAVATMDEFLRENKSRRCIVVCPASVVDNWKNEINVTAGRHDAEIKDRFKAQTLSNPAGRGELVRNWHQSGGAVIVSYESLASILDGNTATAGMLRNAGLLVADEAHRARKADGRLYKMLSGLECPKVLLTGFPIQNQMVEFRNLLSLVDDTFAKMTPAFAQYGFQEPIARRPELKDFRVHTLNDLAQPAMVRRGPDVSKANLDNARRNASGTVDVGEGRVDFLVLCALNDLQKKLYKAYMEHRTQTALSETTENEGVLMSNQFAIRLGADPNGLLKDLEAQFAESETVSETEFATDSATDAPMTPWAYRRKMLLYKASDESENVNGTEDVVTAQKGNDTYVRMSSKTKVGLRLDPVSRNVLGRVHPLTDDYEEYVNAELREQNVDSPQAPSPFAWFREADYENIEEDPAVPKLAVCYDIVNGAWDIEDRSLVFSQSMATLDAVGAMFERNGYTVFRVDGSTPQSKRQGEVNKFKDCQDRCVFIASTMAAGEGLNIQVANHVVLMDSCWNPCPDEQVICRAYRYGQTKSVFVYRLVGCGTLEERVLETQLEKSKLASQIVDGVKKELPEFWRVERFHGTKWVNVPINDRNGVPRKDYLNITFEDDSQVKSVIRLDIPENAWDKTDKFKKEAADSYQEYAKAVNRLRVAEKRRKTPNKISVESRAYRALY